MAVCLPSVCTCPSEIGTEIPETDSPANLSRHKSKECRPHRPHFFVTLLFDMNLNIGTACRCVSAANMRLPKPKRAEAGPTGQPESQAISKYFDCNASNWRCLVDRSVDSFHFVSFSTSIDVLSSFFVFFCFFFISSCRMIQFLTSELGCLSQSEHDPYDVNCY